MSATVLGAAKKSDLAAYRAQFDLQVRFRDTDAMGHVNNAVYLSYLEYARMKYWEAQMRTRDYSKLDFILVRAEIDFRSPVKLGEDIRIGIRASAIGRSSWEFEYRIVETNAGRMVAEARTVQCSFDYQKQKVKRLTPEFKAGLAAFDGSAA